MNSTLQIDNPRHEYRYFNFLSMLFLSIMLGTYILAYKMVAIGKYIESGGIFIFPINYAITDITTEVYGLEKTKKLVKSAIICCAFFAIIVPFIGLLPGPENWPHQSRYNYILGNVWRFFIANTVGIILGIYINSFLISKWKILLNGKYFWLRSIGASSIGELITSIIADIIAFAGTMDLNRVFKLMMAIYCVKFIYAILLAWPSTLLVTHLKLKEGINLFDNKLKFNPFTKT